MTIKSESVHIVWALFNIQ